jgi:hypothetical protein
VEPRDHIYTHFMPTWESRRSRSKIGPASHSQFSVIEPRKRVFRHIKQVSDNCVARGDRANVFRCRRKNQITQAVYVCAGSQTKIEPWLGSAAKCTMYHA